MHFVIERFDYTVSSMNPSFYVRFNHKDKGICEAWIDNKKEADTIEGKENKSYGIYCPVTSDVKLTSVK